MKKTIAASKTSHIKPVVIALTGVSPAIVSTLLVKKNDIRTVVKNPTITKGEKVLRNLLNFRFDRSLIRSAIIPTEMNINPLFLAKLGKEDKLKNGSVAVVEKRIVRMKNSLTEPFSS